MNLIKVDFVFVVVDCGLLFVLRNGSLFGNFMVFFNELLFYCDFGFLFGGFFIRIC